MGLDAASVFGVDSEAICFAAGVEKKFEAEGFDDGFFEILPFCCVSAGAESKTKLSHPESK